MPSLSDLPSLEQICGLSLTPERLNEVLNAYMDILVEIRKLRDLELTDVHPPILFDPLAVYRQEDQS
jgi:hypothetical protein